jgi:hypothetical protein
MNYKFFAVVLFAATFLVSGAYAQNTYYLPQVANGTYAGGSDRTTFILFNNTSSRATVSLDLTDDNGNPLTLTITGRGTGSSFPIDLPAGASVMLQTNGQGALAVGAAKVTSNVAIGVSAIFTIYDSQGNYVTETGVGSSVTSTSFVLPVDTTGSFNTGLALYNTGGTPVTVTMNLYNTSGQQAASTLVLPTPLGANAHTAQFVAGTNQLFPSMTNFQGTLVVTCTSPIAAMVLRQYSNGSALTFTSLPIVPTSSTKTSLNLAQVGNGGGIQTSFLIFNFSSSAANITLTLTKDNGSPLSVTIPGRGTASTFTFSNLAPNASLFLQTDGAPASTDVGAAAIASNVPIGAAGVFTVKNSAGVFQTETGVGDSSVLTTFTLPVDVTGNFNTALALFYPGGSSAGSCTFRLLDSSGNQVGSDVTRDFSSQPHLAIFVDQLFPGTSNFRGTLAVTSTTGVSAMTLRYNSSPLSYTTLPVVSGAYLSTGGTATTSRLLSTTETGIAATSNVVRNKTLLTGFRLSGAITGPGQATGVLATSGSSIYAGVVNTSTGRYVIVLPAGTYTLKISFTPNGVSSSQSLNVTSTVTGSVTVAGDTTANITLPTVTLFNVSGTVIGLSNLSATATGLEINFVTADGSIDGTFSLNANGNYQGLLPAATYSSGISASISHATSLLPISQTLGMYNLGPATVSGATVIPPYTVPATATLSGTVNGTGTPVIGVSVGASTESSTIVSSSTADMLSAQYKMLLPRNLTYTVDVTMALISGSSYLGSIVFPNPGSSLNLSADVVNYNFTVPTLPSRVTISGKVTDASNNPVSDVSVLASSQSITNTPNLQFSTFAQTDAGGNYSISVLSGTNYQLVFYPPPPTP